MRGLVPHDRVCEMRSGAVLWRRAWPVGAAHSVLSGRSSRRCAGALSSPSRWWWRLLHRRERPAVSGELARDGDHDDRARLASGLERVPASVQPAGAAVGLGSHGERACLSRLRSSVTLRRGAAALVPGGLDQQPARVRVAGLGDRALAAALAARVLARGEAEERAERLGPEPCSSRRARRSARTPSAWRRRGDRRAARRHRRTARSRRARRSPCRARPVLVFASSIRP